MPTTTRTRRATRPAGKRTTVPQRRGIAGGWLQRRQPQKRSAFTRAMDALPRRAAKPSSGKGRRRGGLIGGLAVLAGAAGLAFKNRRNERSQH